MGNHTGPCHVSGADQLKDLVRDCARFEQYDGTAQEGSQQGARHGKTIHPQKNELRETLRSPEGWNKTPKDMTKKMQRVPQSKPLSPSGPAWASPLLGTVLRNMASQRKAGGYCKISVKMASLLPYAYDFASFQWVRQGSAKVFSVLKRFAAEAFQC